MWNMQRLDSSVSSRLTFWTVTAEQVKVDKGMILTTCGVTRMSTIAKTGPSFFLDHYCRPSL